MSSQEYLNLFTMDIGDFEIEHLLTEDQERLVTSNKSVFVLGRSGFIYSNFSTGKTTAMIYKLNRRHHQFASLDPNIEDSRLKSMSQLMLTVSPRLVNAMKEIYSRPHPGLNRSPAVKDVFISFRELLFVLDPEFFARFNKKISHDWSINTSSDEPEFTILSEKEVNFERFENSYYHSFRDSLKKNISSSLLFTEFLSIIKGQSSSLDSVSGYISRSQYISIAKTRQKNNIDEMKRSEIYDCFEIYQKEKSSRGEFDLSDATFQIYAKLASRKLTAPQIFDFVYVDEVQDMSIAQLEILKFLSINYEDGFMLAGDTAQTISSGVSFRFEDVILF